MTEPTDLDNAERLTGLLGEYADRVSAVASGLLELFTDKKAEWADNEDRIAWLLDRAEAIKRPLLNVVGRASQLLEHAELVPSFADELSLRLAEVEAQLHHMLRLSERCHNVLSGTPLGKRVARSRMAAGLSGMKGGPLRTA